MNFFDNDTPVFTAAAPGRLDVMGGIADYSGSLLLQMPIAETTVVEVQPRNDTLIRLQSLTEPVKTFSFNGKRPTGKSLEEAGVVIRGEEGGDWAAYVIGCFLVLQKEKGSSPAGANVRIQSSVPLGKGVSSSAALEVATMHALCKMYGVSLNGYELPVLAQRVENCVAGAACGLMDQLAVHFGRKNSLLPIVCQPHRIDEPVSLPHGISFCGIDSGVSHAVGSASYSDVRTAAFMGYTFIALREGATKKDLEKAKQTGRWEELPYGGYLANIPASVFDEKYGGHLPPVVKGKDYLQQVGVSIDNATNVEAEKEYKVLACAKHPVYEMHRIEIFQRLLRQLSASPTAEDDLKKMGTLMLESHRSYSAVGLGNEATDEIAEAVMRTGVGAGLYGARVSGGGNGGTVAVLCKGKEGVEAARAVHEKRKEKCGQDIHFFSGSSDGALWRNDRENSTTGLKK